TIFSLVNAILLRPLPYPDSESILSITASWPQTEKSGFSPANFLDLREQTKSFQTISAFGMWSYDVSGASEPESLTACRATHGFFEVFGVQPLLGRPFLPDDEIEGKHQVTILSHALWKRRYAADPNIIGKPILLDGLPFVVVGVMPEKFSEPEFVDLWAPLAFTSEQKQQRGAWYLQVIGRMKQGITQQQAQLEVSGVGSTLVKQYPQFNDGMNIQMIPTSEALSGPLKPTLLIFWGAVIFVLLVACGNLANLMLASTVSREREFALRMSLGASPVRLRHQLLTECLLLAIIGGVLGLLISLWSIPAMVALAPEETPRLNEVTMNGTVLLFSILLSALTGILFGMAPALRVSGYHLSRFLKQDSTGGGTDPRKVHLRDLLVTSQVAVVLVLLVGAGLLIRSFERLRSVDPGFNPERVLSLQLFLPPRYSEPDARRSVSSQLLEKVRTVPEIQSAAIASPAPFDSVPHLIDAGFRIEGQPALRPGQEPVATFTRVSEDFFGVMQIPIRKGRAFRTSDDANAIPVTIVNEALEKRFWPEKGAVGQRIIVGVRKPVTVEIVGVVGSIKQINLGAADRPQLYVPFQQNPSGAISILVRTKGKPENVVSALKTQLWAVDPSLPATYLATAENLLSDSLKQPRSNTVLISLFAGIAFLLAMIGLYGVMAYSVSRRTREIGVRISLGAQKHTILKMILSHGIRLTLFGVLAGIAGALALTRFISSLLFEVSSRDPMILFFGVSAMIAISLIASYIPARRAMNVDPIVALRYE
ncbi:MAG: ABC transporter permease, partial [Acidobacteriota bacterium]